MAEYADITYKGYTITYNPNLWDTGKGGYAVEGLPYAWNVNPAVLKLRIDEQIAREEVAPAAEAEAAKPAATVTKTEAAEKQRLADLAAQEEAEQRAQAEEYERAARAAEEAVVVEPYRERETTRQRQERLAAERTAAEKETTERLAVEQKVAAELEAYQKAMDAKAAAYAEVMSQEAVRKAAEAEATAAKKAAAEIREDVARKRAEAKAAKIKADVDLKAKQEALAAQTYAKEIAAAEKAKADEIVALAALEEMKLKLKLDVDPTAAREYTISYTEKGVDKQKTFTTPEAAATFIGELPKYSIFYKGKEYGFATKAEADDYVQDIYTSDTLGVSLKEFQSWSPSKQQILHNQRMAPRTLKYSVTYMTESGERTAVFDNKAAADKFAADKKIPTILPSWAGGAPDTTGTTRDFAKELVEDSDKFLREITESPGKYIYNVPKKITDVREDLGEFLRDLTDLSERYRWKSNLPTRAELEAYYKENPQARYRPGGRGSPFQAKNPDEFFNAIAAITINAGVGVTKAMTFPISMGLAPTKKEYPEQMITQLAASLLTLSPADVLFTRSVGAAARITGADRVAVQAMSRLQRLGIRGQNILNKLLTDQSLTKAEANMWESMAGAMGTSTKQLRDTSGRLFIRFDSEDAGDIARIVDDAFTDMTGVQDWTDLEKILPIKVADPSDIPEMLAKLGITVDDAKIMSPQYQDIVVRELQRQLADMRGALGQLTDIDPGTGMMTRWGVITDAKDVKKLGDAYKKLFNLYEENAASFGAGAAVRPTALLAVEEILADVGADPDVFFESVDDIINFLANNPASGADLLLFLNQPVSATHPKAEPTVDILSEIKEASTIEIKNILKGIDVVTIKDVVVDIDPEILPDVIQELDDDLKVAIIPIIDPKILPDIMQDFDLDTTVDVVQELDDDTKVMIIPKLDLEVIPEVITELDPKIIPDIISKLPDPQIQKIVPVLEERFPPDVIDDIERRLPRRLRLKFREARKKKPPKKIPRSKYPEPYRVSFQYIVGSETEKVDAKTFKEAYTIADGRRKSKLHPTEVRVHRLGVI